MKRRNLILLLGGASSGAMTIGTGAFSSAQVERGVNVNVVPDDEAFVGYNNTGDTGGEKEATDGETVELVTIENRFADDVELSISGFSVTPESGEHPDIDEASLGFSAGTEPENLETIHVGAGESETIVGTVSCDGNSGRATVEVTVRVEGGGVSAELFGDTETRRFEIVCQEAPQYTAVSSVGVDGVDFKGSGNAEVVSSEGGNVTVQVYYIDSGDVTITDPENVSVNQNLRGRMSIGGNTIVGVHIEDIGDVFVHPQFTSSDCDVTPDDNDDDESDDEGGDNGNGNGNGNGVSGGKVTETVNPDDAFDGCFDGD